MFLQRDGKVVGEEEGESPKPGNRSYSPLYSDINQLTFAENYNKMVMNVKFVTKQP